MQYLIISYTHKNSTLDVREKLTFNEDEAKELCLKALCAHENINEAIVLSTCNRIEIITSCSHVGSASEHIFKLLESRSKFTLNELEGRADIFDDQGAIHHLFSVASSLDSLVVGETQIAGQLKDAYRFSHEQGCCGQKLSRALHYAFKCAAEVRNVSDISSKPVSVASVAIAQVKKEIPSLEGKRALVIGSGEMSRITAKHLVSSGVEVTITNRTMAKAQLIADECGGKVRDFEELSEAINEYDLLFTATSAPAPIIREMHLKEVSFVRYWFDMAVPRDILINENVNIRLFAVDDLKTIVDENIMMREDEARASYSVVGRYTMEFFTWLQTLSIEPLIKEIYLQAETSARQETQNVMDHHYIPDEYEAAMLKMNQQVLKRFLHDITSRLRDVSSQAKSDTLLESIKFAFGINDENTLKDEYKCERNIKG